MLSLKDNIQQEIHLKVNLQNNFKCNICKEYAQQPVVTLCGHLYCWHCVHDNVQCYVCDKKFEQNQFLPIYTNHESQNQKIAKRQLPPKPKAKNRQRIKNFTSSNNSSLPLNLRLDNNVERGIVLAGNGYFPSIVINLFGNFNQIQAQVEPQNQNIKNSLSKFSIFLLLIVSILILMS